MNLEIKASVYLQAWWRKQSTLNKFKILHRNSRVWRELLLQNELVVYGGVCLRVFKNSMPSRIFLNKVFLVLTTQARLLLLDPYKKQILESFDLQRHNLGCSDLGEQVFSISVIYYSNKTDSHKNKVLIFQDFFNPIYNWVKVLDSLPSLIDLMKISRKNSFSPTNFSQHQIGEVLITKNFRNRFLSKSLTLIHGTKIITFHNFLNKYSEIELDQCSEVIPSETYGNMFLLKVITGDIYFCFCKTEAERNSWVEELIRIIHRLVVGVVCVQRRRKSKNYSDLLQFV